DRDSLYSTLFTSLETTPTVVVYRAQVRLADGTIVRSEPYRYEIPEPFAPSIIDDVVADQRRWRDSLAAASESPEEFEAALDDVMNELRVMQDDGLVASYGRSSGGTGAWV